jgi:two-component system cell cycle response regulator
MQESITEDPTGPSPFWKRPEQVLLDAGKDGELVIARIRIAVTGVLLLVPIAGNIEAANAGRPLHWIGLIVTFAAFALSWGILLMVSQDRRQRWLPLATSLFDVSFISLTQLLYAFAVNPLVLLNNRLTFDTYFVALVGTCLRFDRRVALIAGITAIVQFLGSVILVAHHFDVAAVGDVAGYGRFQWSDQFSRVILLGAVTALNVFIVSGLQHQRRLSNADALTGAFNRRFLEHYLRNELARATRHKTSLAVALVDVDHFKRLNDDFGHAAGDRVLRRIAQTLEGAVRRTDLIARYGGEEFVVVLPESTAAQAMMRMEKIREAIASAALPLDKHKARSSNANVKVTISVGIASWPEDGKLATELIASADRRMYQAKKLGRNQCVGPDSPLKS